MMGRKRTLVALRNLEQGVPVDLSLVSYKLFLVARPRETASSK